MRNWLLSVKEFKKISKTLDIFINIVQDGGMAIKGTEDIRRLSVSFLHKIYDFIEEMLSSKKVSIALVVKDAVETYIKKQEDNTNVIPDARNV
jgi:hypothetical protein